MMGRWSQALAICALVVGVASSHRPDVAARRGFTPQAMEEMRARSLYGRQVEAPKRRYYTNDTKSEWSQHNSRVDTS